MGRKKRWGDLSAEEKAALPEGTVLVIAEDIWLRRTRQGWYYEGPSVSPGWGEVNPPPPYAYLSCPRDSDGPAADERGSIGRANNGVMPWCLDYDLDFDGDVPEVARDTVREAVPLVLEGGYAYTQVQEVQTDQGLSLRYSGMARLYWPANCEGADDSPRDCLPEADDGR